MEQQSKKKAVSLSITALVLGICAFIPFFGIICGIIGLIIAGKAKKECAVVDFPKGMATGGTIAAIIGLVFTLIFVLVIIFGAIS